VIPDIGEAAKAIPAIAGCFVQNPLDLVSLDIKFKTPRAGVTRARAREKNVSPSFSLFFVEVREQSPAITRNVAAWQRERNCPAELFQSTIILGSV